MALALYIGLVLLAALLFRRMTKHLTAIEHAATFLVYLNVNQIFVATCTNVLNLLGTPVNAFSMWTFMISQLLFQPLAALIFVNAWYTYRKWWVRTLLFGSYVLFFPWLYSLNSKFGLIQHSHWKFHWSIWETSGYLLVTLGFHAWFSRRLRKGARCS